MDKKLIAAIMGAITTYIQLDKKLIAAIMGAITNYIQMEQKTPTSTTVTKLKTQT